MATAYDFTTPLKVTITNLLNDDNPTVLTQALTGTRIDNGTRLVMTLADAKVNGFTIYDYLLDRAGNFIVDEQTVPTADPTVTSIDMDKVLVVTEQATKQTDRYIQFFATQQKIRLKAGDSLTFEAKHAAELAYYQQMAVDGEIGVEIAAPAAEPTP